MANACGLHAQPQSKGFDRAAFLKHVRAADYLTCTVLDDLQLTIDLKIPYGVYRSWEFEPQPKENTQNAGVDAADEAFDELLKWRNENPGSENILFMVNCEQFFGIGVSWMYARLIQRCATEVSPPIGLVVGNWASGAVKCGQGNDRNQWIDSAEPLLRALEKYGNVRLPSGAFAFPVGLHEYTGIHAWIAANGGLYEQRPYWGQRPAMIDWSLPQWHLGRFIQGILQACDYFEIAAPPKMLITECLFDDMADVAQRIPNLKLADGYEKARGWRSLIPQHQIWYPQWDASSGQTYAKLVKWVWQNVYKPLGFVIGMHVYTYGSTGDWESFRVDNAPGYLEEMEIVSDTTPVLMPNASGQYDMLQVLCGSTDPYVGKNSWASNERFWMERGVDTIWYQRKNDHAEEFGRVRRNGVEYIVRGLDDSPGGGFAYVVTNEDGSQGSAWCPRWMRPGEKFFRVAIVKYYELQSGKAGPSYTDRTWLTFVKFHPVWTSYGGLTINGVIELEAALNNNGAPGTVFEKYWYSVLGLVGWQGGDGMKKMMGIVTPPGNVPKTPRMNLSWYGGLKLPAMADINIPINDSRWADYKVKTKKTAAVNVRSVPSADIGIPVVATIEPGVEHTLKSIPQEKLTAAERDYSNVGGYIWYPILKANKSGVLVAGWARNDVIDYAPVAAPLPPAIPPETVAALLASWARMQTHLQGIYTEVEIVESLFETIEPPAAPSTAESE